MSMYGGAGCRDVFVILPGWKRSLTSLLAVWIPIFSCKIMDEMMISFYGRNLVGYLCGSLFVYILYFNLFGFNSPQLAA